jgi:hypothetical protein
MELVGLLTLEQKTTLLEPQRKLVQPSWYFNPIQDLELNWVISQAEIDNSIYTENEWVKTLPLIVWNPPLPVPPIG